MVPFWKGELFFSLIIMFFNSPRYVLKIGHLGAKNLALALGTELGSSHFGTKTAPALICVYGIGTDSLCHSFVYIITPAWVHLYTQKMLCFKFMDHFIWVTSLIRLCNFP